MISTKSYTYIYISCVYAQSVMLKMYFDKSYKKVINILHKSYYITILLYFVHTNTCKNSLYSFLHVIDHKIIIYVFDKIFGYFANKMLHFRILLIYVKRLYIEVRQNECLFIKSYQLYDYFKSLMNVLFKKRSFKLATFTNLF